MESVASQPIGHPKSHAAGAVICLTGAVLSLADWPDAAPQHADALLTALVFWGVFCLFQFLLAAGHLRTAILDQQRLIATRHYERIACWSWIVACLLALAALTYLYGQGWKSAPLLADQSTAMATMLVSATLSIAIWAFRLTMPSPQSLTPASTELTHE